MTQHEQSTQCVNTRHCVAELLLGQGVNDTQTRTLLIETKRQNQPVEGPKRLLPMTLFDEFQEKSREAQGKVTLEHINKPSTDYSCMRSVNQNV